MRGTEPTVQACGIVAEKIIKIDHHRILYKEKRRYFFYEGCPRGAKHFYLFPPAALAAFKTISFFSTPLPQEVSKRGEAPLYYLPLCFEGEGDTGGEVENNLHSTRLRRLYNRFIHNFSAQACDKYSD